MANHSATYSPEDDKLRLYPACRLDSDTYARVKASGFSWAPKQQLFYAVWTPSREDLLTELAGDIDDEDKSLVDRAEERAERFEDYSGNRANEAHATKSSVDRIADGIPFGQPILVGHHSERHARRDAEKIENGMRKAVKLWETSRYWTQRAAGAIANAKYKELPAVRYRRIKTLEAELRKCQAAYTPTDNPPHIIQQQVRDWSAGMYKYDGAAVDHVFVGPKGRGGYWQELSTLPAIQAGMQCWEDHLRNRIAYENAMLGESGGIKAEAFDLQIGGLVLDRFGDWSTITRLNKKNGEILSVSTNRKWGGVVSIEKIRDYQPPTVETTETVKKATKLPKLTNYPAENAFPITQAQWDGEAGSYKGTSTISGETAAPHRVRHVENFRLRKFGHAIAKQFGVSRVFITDAKIIEPPKPEASEVAKLPPPVKDLATLERRTEQRAKILDEQKPDEFDALKETLKTGVQVVAVPQLFPTPHELAKKVVRLCGNMAGRRILEPSAGTGQLIRAAVNDATGFDCCRVVAVEINPSLVESLKTMRGMTLYANESNFEIRQTDFLATNGELGLFDRIVMNPPFKDGADIQHIEHAIGKLKPGGRLVAICANGPRQRARLMDRANHWEDLPTGSFADAGTQVNAALFVFDAPPAAKPDEPESNSTNPDEPFKLEHPPAGIKRPARFENNTRTDGKPLRQAVLFPGSTTCLPGQSDLIAQ